MSKMSNLSIERQNEQQETKAETAARLGYKEYDYNMPQSFADDITVILKDMGAEVTHPLAHFVWVYESGCCAHIVSDTKYHMGIPGPLTQDGVEAVRRYNEQS